MHAAITQHCAALEQAARVASAFTHAEETVYACVAKVSEAEAHLAETRSNEGARLAAIALNESVGVSAALNLISYDGGTTCKQRERLESRSSNEQSVSAQSVSARRVKDAAVAVMRAELPVADMLANAQALQEQLIAARPRFISCGARTALPTQI